MMYLISHLEKGEPLYTADGNVQWYSLFVK